MSWQAAVNHDTIGRVQQNPPLVRPRYAHRGGFPLFRGFSSVPLLFLHHLSLPAHFLVFLFYFFFFFSFFRLNANRKIPATDSFVSFVRSPLVETSYCIMQGESWASSWRMPGTMPPLFFLCEEVRDLGRIWNFDTFRSSFVSFSLSLSFFYPFFRFRFVLYVLTMFRPWLEARQRRFYGTLLELARANGVALVKMCVSEFWTKFYLPYSSRLEKYRCCCSLVVVVTSTSYINYRSW